MAQMHIVESSKKKNTRKKYGRRVPFKYLRFLNDFPLRKLLVFFSLLPFYFIIFVFFFSRKYLPQLTCMTTNSNAKSIFQRYIKDNFESQPRARTYLK